MKLRREQENSIPAAPVVQVLQTDPCAGLTDAQVHERLGAGLANTPVESPAKTPKQIVLSNIFTFFNILFLIFAVCLIVVGAPIQNLTFLGVITCNTLIGIVQELRSYKELEKLTIVSAPRATVVREGRETSVPASETVRDDVVIFSAGNQIFADAVVLEGACQVNEALVTGEADEISKGPGDTLLSGSFLVNGTCRARLTAVGAEAFAARLTVAAKKSQKRQMGEMMRSLTKLIKIIGAVVIPFGVILCIKEIVWLGRDLVAGVTSSVAALLGMIPEGLYLLTSLALVAGTLRLARRRTLVHEMACIETLARVDVLCVDKTGTITESSMTVEDVIPTCEDRFVAEDIRMIMADYVNAMADDNETMHALKEHFGGETRQTAIDTLPFSSKRKYGGVSFHEDETYLLGAPDVILGARYAEYAEQVDAYAAAGSRVLLLALYDGSLQDQTLEKPVMPLALLLLNNKIREDAPDTFRYFMEQGVAVKVISGDNPLTVSQVAKAAGIPGAEYYVDARTLKTNQALRAAAEKYTVFGRVTPEQKRKLVRALKSRGHTVAMTGDGVNDILALKEADCSIAMASGSDVASQVSNIVLMNSNFAALPSVVSEGRRVINNIECVASLYLVKNIFSFFLALITLFATLPYPLMPAQLSLVGALTIGAPSFVLAMEPSNRLVTGKFLPKVIVRALPAAFTDLILVIGVLLFYLAFQFSDAALSTICTAIMGVVGLCMVHRTCIPYTTIRKLMLAAMIIAFVGAFILLRQVFTLTDLVWSEALILAVFALLAYPVMWVLEKLTRKLFGSLLDKTQA